MVKVLSLTKLRCVCTQTEKNTSCTSDAMELAADNAQASGEESGHRTEAEAGTFTSGRKRWRETTLGFCDHVTPQSLES